MGFSLKKITKAVKKAAHFVAAPMVVATEVVAKGATYTAAKAGIPGAAKADKFMKKELAKTVGEVKVHALVGAAVGAAVLGQSTLAGVLGGAAAKELAGEPPRQEPSGETPPTTAAETPITPPPEPAPPTFLEWLASLFGGGAT